MKRFFAVSGLILAVIFVLGPGSFGLAGLSWGHGSEGGGYGRAQGGMHFDSSAIRTITGRVVAYDTIGGFGHFGMKALTVESEGRTLTIMLGPEFYLTDEKLSLKEGDEISVEAAPAGNRTKTFFIARSVTAAGKTIALRDEAGLPLWRGQGRNVRNGGGNCPGCGSGHGMMGSGMMGRGMMGPARMIPPGR